MGSKSSISHILAGFSFCFILLAFGAQSPKANFAQTDVAALIVKDISDTIPPKINHEMLEMFEAFKKRGTISESFFDQLLSNPELRDPEKWRQVWEEYRDAILHKEDPLEHKEFVGLVEKEVDALVKEEKYQEAATSVSTREPQASVVGEVEKDEKNAVHAVAATPTLTHSRPAKQSIVRYHIQIAASVLPLDEPFLKRLYSGAAEIHQFHEDQWEKYYVGEFSEFDQAREAIKNVGVKGAFIIAFCLDQKIIAYRARQVEKIFSNTQLQTFHCNPNSEYRIQIAASKSPMLDNELKHLIPDLSNMGIIYEDYWYKYSIPAAANLAESKEIVKTVNANGAFIVRYQRGKLLPLR